jgi:hypothetical protein
MPTSYYRYVDDAERQFIERTMGIRSASGVTWYAVDPPSFYVTQVEVQRFLAIPSGMKTCSIGPIPDDEAPPMDVVPPRTVVPQQLPDGTWVPGGGTEAATSHEFRLLGWRGLI